MYWTQAKVKDNPSAEIKPTYEDKRQPKEKLVDPKNQLSQHFKGSIEA